MMNEEHTIKQRILNYARNHGRVGFAQLVSDLGLKPNTARQYLSRLSRGKKLVRVGNGEYMFPDKQIFMFIPTKDIEKLYNGLKEAFPLADFASMTAVSLILFNTMWRLIMPYMLKRTGMLSTPSFFD